MQHTEITVACGLHEGRLPAGVADVDRRACRDELPDGRIVALGGRLQEPRTEHFGALDERDHLRMSAFLGELARGDSSPDSRDICSSNEQRARDVDESVRGGKHEGSCPVVGSPVDSRPTFEQVLHRLHRAARRCPHEGRETTTVGGIDGGALGEQLSHPREVSDFCRLDQGGVRSTVLSRSGRLAQK